jgi:hypothetical protein
MNSGRIDDNKTIHFGNHNYLRSPLDFGDPGDPQWTDSFSPGEAVSGLLGPVYLLRER